MPRRSPRPVPRRQRAARIDGRLHEQSAMRRDAGFGAVQTCFAAEGADGQAGCRARHRPRRAAAAERARSRRRTVDRPGADGCSAGGRDDPPRRRARRPSRRSCPATRSACPASGNTTRGEGVRRGTGCRRLQEHLLLGELRRLDGRRVVVRDGVAEVHCAAEVGRGRGCDRAGGAHGCRARDRARAGCYGIGRLRRLGIGVANDVDGRRRRPARLSRGRRGSSGAAARQRSTSSACIATRVPTRSIPRPAR